MRGRLLPKSFGTWRKVRMSDPSHKLAGDQVDMPASPPTIRRGVDIPIGPTSAMATFYSFDNLGAEHLLIAFKPLGGEAPLVRVHSECLTGDVFGSQRCDCGQQLTGAIALLSREGGYLIYLRQEGRGIGLYSKLEAYSLQDEGLDTFEANRHLGFVDDAREYRSAASMLRCAGVSTIRLITNNLDKIAQLEAHGIRVRERIGTPTYLTPYNTQYLNAKAKRANHCIQIGDAAV
jgi:GTP cyclohydrolase II